MSLSKQQQEIERLEHAFWQSMVDGKAKVATDMLTEPAMMVSGHGSMKFDHAGYQKMAADDRHKLVGFTLSNMDIVFPREDVAIASYQASQKMETEGMSVSQEAFDSSTWIKLDGAWKCVAHTESLQVPGARA